MFSEVKFVYQPIKVSFDQGIIEVRLCFTNTFSLLRFLECISYCYLFAFQIKNTHFFDTTQELEFNWLLHGDGCELGSGNLGVPVIEPQGTHRILWESGPWYSLWSSSGASEFFLTITAKILHPTRWVNAGHLISSTQILLPGKQESVPHVSSVPLHLTFL